MGEEIRWSPQTEHFQMNWTASRYDAMASYTDAHLNFTEDKSITSKYYTKHMKVHQKSEICTSPIFSVLLFVSCIMADEPCWWILCISPLWHPEVRHEVTLVWKVLLKHLPAIQLQSSDWERREVHHITVTFNFHPQVPFLDKGDYRSTAFKWLCLFWWDLHSKEQSH